MPAIPKRPECRRLRRCPLEISKEIPELRLPVPLETWAKTNCCLSSKSSPITFAHRFLGDTVNCPIAERKLTRGFLALICTLGLACIGPAAHAGGQRKQQQSGARSYAGQRPAYHNAVGGTGHVNVPANRSALTAKPTPVGKPTAVGKTTRVAHQPGNRANKHKAEPAPQAVSTNARRNTAIRSSIESTISKNPKHQTLQAPMGSPIAGLPKWNFPTKSKPDLMLTRTAAVSTSASQNFFVAQRGIPSRLVTLVPTTPVATSTLFQRRPIDIFTLPPPIPPTTTALSYGPAFHPPNSGQPENSAPTATTSQPLNMANGTETGPPSTFTSQPLNTANGPLPAAMPTNIPRNVVNEQGTGKKAPAGQFQQNRRIQGSDQWVDSDYDVFRNYRSEWHDRDWWRTNQLRIVFCVGGWYYWNGGYWFPAWGYDPEADYAYDGPIYAYKDWPPDQVTANVQGTLQKQGFYQGESDGLLASPTSAALAGYQHSHGLYETSTIDRPTSQSLGMK
jgi:hypothetical protein